MKMNPLDQIACLLQSEFSNCCLNRCMSIVIIKSVRSNSRQIVPIGEGMG